MDVDYDLPVIRKSRLQTPKYQIIINNLIKSIIPDVLAVAEQGESSQYEWSGCTEFDDLGNDIVATLRIVFPDCKITLKLNWGGDQIIIDWS
jgi:hypothetical protein